MEYENFDLKMSKGIGQEYSIEVIYSPAGEGKGAMCIPDALHEQLPSLKNAVLPSINNHDRGLKSVLKKSGVRPVDIKAFGQELFNAVMAGDVGKRYRASKDRVESQKKGLRIRLRIDQEVPELAAYPWEFLCDPEGERKENYLSLSNQTPITRYLQVGISPKSLHIKPPLCILGMIASPQGSPELDVEGEKKRMNEELKSLIEAGQVEFKWLNKGTNAELQRELRKKDWHVFHFIGHGGFDANKKEGLIELEDENGQKDLFLASQLGGLLADEKSLRLVVLNACSGAEGSDTDLFSSTASELISCGVPAVVAMQFKISDQGAIQFARNFYQSIAEGKPVDYSVTEARKHIKNNQETGAEWATPVLHMRSPDGRLFEFEKEEVPVITASEKSISSAIRSTSTGKLIMYGAIGIILAVAAFFFLKPEKLAVADTYAIVLDASQAMFEKLPDGIKGGESVATVLESGTDIDNESDNVSLVLFSGGDNCSDFSDLIYDFGQNRFTQVCDKIRKLEPGQLNMQSSLTKVVVGEIKRLHMKTDHFKNDITYTRKIILLTASSDIPCTITHVDSIRKEIEETLNKKNIEYKLLKSAKNTEQTLQDKVVGTAALELVRQSEAAGESFSTYEDFLKELANIEIRPVAIGLDSLQRENFKVFCKALKPELKPYFADNTDELRRVLGTKASAEKFQKYKDIFLEAIIHFNKWTRSESMDEFEYARKKFLTAANEGKIYTANRFLAKILNYQDDLERALEYYKRAGDKGDVQSKKKFVEIVNVNINNPKFKKFKKKADQYSDDLKQLMN